MRRADALQSHADWKFVTRADTLLAFPTLYRDTNSAPVLGRRVSYPCPPRTGVRNAQEERPMGKSKPSPKRKASKTSTKRGPHKSQGGNQMSTTDPAQIPNAAGIPPQGATFAGVSPGKVAVYSGTI